jgi:hypothetical protein
MMYGNKSRIPPGRLDGFSRPPAAAAGKTPDGGKLAFTPPLEAIGGQTLSGIRQFDLRRFKR